MRQMLCSAAVLCLVLLASCGDEDGPTPDLENLDAQTLEQVVAAFNKGVGHMDRYEPKDAIKAFDRVLELAPGWTTARLDLGIALLNAENDELYPRAEAELLRVIKEAPNDPRGSYALGMLLVHLTRYDEAVTRFQRVLTLDPDDPDTHYQLGSLMMEKDPTAARRHLELAYEAMPHHENACYRLFRLLTNAGEETQAQAMLARFQTLKAAGAGEPTSIKFGEMGRYADVVRAFAVPGVTIEPEAPSYADAAKERGLVSSAALSGGMPGAAGAALGPGVAIADLDDDGDLDLYVASLAPGAPGTLFRNDDGNFTAIPEHGVDVIDVVGATFGDYDGDGDPDLYLTRIGTNALFRNDEGRFSDVTTASATGGPATTSVGAAWADADHDGDLDLFVANRGAPNFLFTNNGDGVFTDVAQTAGIDGGQANSMSVAFLDVDGDRDLDLYVVNDGTANRLYLNDRVGLYRDATERFGALGDPGPGLGACIADVDGNGLEDIILIRGDAAPRLVLQRTRGRFEVDRRFDAARATGALVADLDLDGWTDVVLLGAADDGSHHVHMNQGGGRMADGAPLGSPGDTPRGAVAADFDGDGTLDLLVARATGAPQLFATKRTNRHHWLEVVPGRAKDGGGFTADAGAIGLAVEAKTGRRTLVASTRSLSGYLGGTPARVHLGLGRQPKADYVRIQWPDAVLQSELEVPADRRWEVTKVERKPSSCPILFAWDGEGFAFVTDFLGVGGMGFFVEPGVYAPPDPTEDVRIPPHQIAPKDGRYLLRVTEPLEEVTYLDALHLVVYDHPADTEIYLDERFAAVAPFPTGKPYAIEERIFPRHATDYAGNDVTKTLESVDRDQVEPPVDKRFIGYASDHALELDFTGRVPDVPEGRRLVLFLDGWVEYTYSHVNYAAWQAGIVMKSPSLEVPDGRGGWRTAIADIGFPAGLPRTMSVDVTDLPLAKDGRLRIRSNMELFWDRAFLAVEQGNADVTRHRLDPTVAELRYLGYPREYSPDGKIPTLYDYKRVDPGLPFKILSGAYTRFGDVRPLLRAADDRSVVMGRGEEVALEFDTRALPPLKPGYARTVVLHSEGWCKDMDLYTAFPDTVEPLPFRAMKNYPPEAPPPDDPAWHAWQKKWNTRIVRDRP